jgi:hypothetical protein
MRLLTNFLHGHLTVGGGNLYAPRSNIKSQFGAFPYNFMMKYTKLPDSMSRNEIKAGVAKVVLPVLWRPSLKLHKVSAFGKKMAIFSLFTFLAIFYTHIYKVSSHFLPYVIVNAVNCFKISDLEYVVFCYSKASQSGFIYMPFAFR